MKLVYIGKVIEVKPIENADRIESVNVICGSGGIWWGVAQKNQFAVGDNCEVYLQDSLLPHTERFAFMEKTCWRVRICRFRGALSECLVMPQVLAGDIGDDVTDVSGVTRYEKPLPVTISGDILGHFPAFIIPKTDEPNVQGVPEMVTMLQGKPFYATIKVDGTSTTVFKWQCHFGVCSRNYELKPSDTNTLWQLVYKYDLEKKLPENYSVQWETIGPGIQGNPLGLAKVSLQCFNVYDILNKKYLNGGDASQFCIIGLGLPFVEPIVTPETFTMNVDELRALVEKQVYHNGKPAEGIVVRPLNEEMVEVNHETVRLSFKVINPLYRD